jgi:hypothetical protein
VDGSWDYRPYSYCNGDAYASGYFGVDGPHFSFRLGF